MSVKKGPVTLLSVVIPTAAINFHWGQEVLWTNGIAMVLPIIVL